MGTTTTTPVIPRIISVRFTLADGSERRRTIRCPYYSKDPHASLYGLQARLADLTLDGRVTRHSISVPAEPRHLVACIRARGTKGHRCQCFRRWTEIEELAA
jgi:hypothetical protein